MTNIFHRLQEVTSYIAKGDDVLYRAIVEKDKNNDRI